jgi:predicted N-formylglutamate amidohydrolase
VPMPEDVPPAPLLEVDEPSPVVVTREHAASRFVVVCEHAGRVIPRSLGDLGLPERERSRHIAWDIGALALAQALAERLDAILFSQVYSRLVCDCNRQPSARDFIPEISEMTGIPGNIGLDAAARTARERALFRPFHDRIAAEMDRRMAAGERPILVTVHSFTPIFKGVSRPWQAAVLYNRDRVFAPRIAELLRADPTLRVGVNEPYFMSDETDYTVPVHGERRGLPCVEFEVRNDLLSTAEEAALWADRLADSTLRAAQRLGAP